MIIHVCSDQQFTPKLIQHICTLRSFYGIFVNLWSEIKRLTLKSKDIPDHLEPTKNMSTRLSKNAKLATCRQLEAH
jgi:hypothetical protein